MTRTTVDTSHRIEIRGVEMDVRVVTLRDSVNKNKKVIEVIKPRKITIWKVRK